MRKMENEMIEFTVNSSIANAFYQLKFDQIKRIIIKANSIFDDLDDFYDTNPVYHSMVGTMAVGVLSNININEEIFSEISDMEYANKFSKRLKKINRTVNSHPGDIKDLSIMMYDSLGTGHAEKYSADIPDDGDVLEDTLNLMESVSDFIGPQLSAEWVKKPTFTTKFEIKVWTRGTEYVISGKKKLLSEHKNISINGESGYETTEKEGMIKVTTRGHFELGKDIVSMEFSPMGNITLSCENEEVFLDAFA